MTKKVLISLDDLLVAYNNMHDAKMLAALKVGFTYPQIDWLDDARNTDKLELAHWFNAQAAASQWTPIPPLPDDNMDVFVQMFYDKRDLVKAHYSKIDNAFYLYHGGVRMMPDRFTHWMPIPPLPEVKNGA